MRFRHLLRAVWLAFWAFMLPFLFLWALNGMPALNVNFHNGH